ncbi:MAG: thiazole synthase [Candidatus Berkiella sp.]
MWQLGNKQCRSRLLMGTARFPSLAILCESIKASQTDIITVSLKRENMSDRKNTSFWDEVASLNCHILPNTAGCRTAKEAIYVAQMAQSLFETNWIKLEVINDETLLSPDPFELIKAASALIKLGFEVFPFCTDDFSVCKSLYELGCQILMPWGAPIGSGKGLLNTFALSTIRERLEQATLIIDAGIGSPVHAMQAMLLGYDGILVNTAIASATTPVQMATAFRLAVKSGRIAYQAGVIPECDFAVSSTDLDHTIFGAY